ncbi:hypothetical protein [Veronia nyctiphanis]|uniref:hypothetical protein n=1 Tax=Veronia nyctiphanis TaxID=1278244 RepID=UPI00191C5558|nr:hypothetical protein [Veronia nyctiphanis]
MKRFKKWLILAALIVAMVSYFYGSFTGLTGFIVLAIVFEMAFWVGLFSKKEEKPSS